MTAGPRRRGPAAAATHLPSGFAEQVVAWQREHGRHDLPWQGTRDPYRVWLSEVMLQQTQVATVLPYYRRFVDRFPDVRSLAAAGLGDVLALWSGLGYYSRARNLHRCAQLVVAEHDGRFPTTSAELAKLPGIGRSTAAAIAAFSFGERTAILDGNVKRVLARVLAFGRDLAEPASTAALWDRATALLPEHDIEPYTQGMMDIGATICLARSPHCLLCPVGDVCAARAAGDPERYPVKTRRTHRHERFAVWLELRRGDRVFLVERPSRGIWAGLWSLPEIESMPAFDALASAWPGTREDLPPFVHTLTHVDWTLRPVRWRLPARLATRTLDALTSSWPEGRWWTVAEALALGLPSPLRKRLARETGDVATRPASRAKRSPSVRRVARAAHE